MIPIHIFKTNSFKNKNSELENIIKLLLSSKRIKKKYGQVFLITDLYGKKLIENLDFPYDMIIPLIEVGKDQVTDIDIEIIAFERLTKLIPDYLYIDYKSSFEELIEKKDLIVFNKYMSNNNKLLDFYIKKGCEFYFDFDKEEVALCDLKIFRCTNEKILEDYFESYFTSLYTNKHLFKEKSKLYEFSEFLKQAYFYQVLKKYGVENECYLQACK